MFDSAAKRVFGKTLVCRTLETASQLAKSDDLDCVTLEGEGVGYEWLVIGWSEWVGHRVECEWAGYEVVGLRMGHEEVGTV